MGKLRILVVEDNHVNQLVIKGILAKLGHIATVVEHGELALKAVAAGEFDVIFMGCQMPVMDGFTATRELRSKDVAWPIIAMVGNADPSEKQKCLEAGMNDYLSKPI